jgi:hypothetical protein
MGGTARYRDYDSSTIGSYESWTSGGPVYDDILDSGYCYDTVGDPFTNHELNIYTDRRKGTITGTRPGYSPGQVGYVSMDHWPLEGTAGTYTIPLPAWRGYDYLEQLALSKTNPSRPHVQIPVSLVEMRDIPQLIRTYGKVVLRHEGAWKYSLKTTKFQSVRKELAEQHLAYSFGLAPLISDLRKILQLKRHYNNRVAELTALAEKGGLRRNVLLHNDVDITTLNGIQVSSTNPWVLYADRINYGQRKMWASIRWVPSLGGLLPSDDEAIKRMASHLVLGLHPSQITPNIWDSLPWTWLVDWFVDVGTFLHASNNSIAHNHGSLCIMTHQKQGYDLLKVREGGGSLPSWLSLDETPTRHWEQKVRRLRFPGIAPAFSPFLSGRQLSILGSLAILRSRRGFRS